MTSLPPTDGLTYTYQSTTMHLCATSLSMIFTTNAWPCDILPTWLTHWISLKTSNWRVLRGSNSHPRFRRPRWYPFHQRPMVVVVGIDPTSSAYEAGAHPSTPYNLNRFGVTTGNRTQTKRITISVANRYNMATQKKTGRGTENRTLINRLKAYYFSR